MDNSFYLLSLTINGIKNIFNEICLDFYKKGLAHFDPDMYRVKAIYGENGSGKTGIVTALNVMKNVALSRDYLLQQETQSLLAEIINKKNKEAFLSVEFVRYGDDNDNGVDKYRYTLRLELYEGEYVISEEKLEAIIQYTKNKKYKTLFEVKSGDISYLDLPKDRAKDIEKGTWNLLLHRSVLFKLIENARPSDGFFFVSALYTVIFFLSVNIFLNEEDKHEMYMISKLLRDRQREGKSSDDIDVDNYIERQFFYVDSKGRDIVRKDLYEGYVNKIERMQAFLQLFKPELNEIIIDRSEDGNNYLCELIMCYKEYKVNREFESTGIKKLIRLFDSFSFASKGGIAFIDELDANLNDVYLCKLIEYFMYFSKGQLCFTTHNLGPTTVLKDNKKSIDFLTDNNKLVSWNKKGNAQPENYYRNGMIENVPFNIEAIDFIGVFGN